MSLAADPVQGTCAHAVKLCKDSGGMNCGLSLEVCSYFVEVIALLPFVPISDIWWCPLQSWMVFQCLLRPWMQRLLAIALAATSFIMVWCEATIGSGPNLDLSPFSHVSTWPLNAADPLQEPLMRLHCGCEHPTALNAVQ